MTSKLAIFWASVFSYVVYLVFIRQLFSPYKKLPTANQRSLFLRLFHEPTPFELEQWIKETPNDGLIRYFGFMNQERLLMTKSATLKQVMQREAYKYDKLPSLMALQNPAGVSGLVTSKGDLHKVHRRYTIAAFNSTSTRKLYPKIWQSVLATSDSLFEKVSRNSIIKVNSFFQVACLHTAMQAAFTLDVNVLESTDQPLVKSYWRPFKIGERAPLYLKLLQICPISLQMWAALIVSKGLGINVSRMRALVKISLDERLEKIRNEVPEVYQTTNDEKPQDILEALLRKAHIHLSERALLRHAMTTMAASLEMVSNQLSWAIYALSRPKNMQIQENLRSEIRARFPCPPETLTWEDISSLRYLWGVLNEILRLYPNVSQRGRVCNTATTVFDVPIPKGTILTWPVYAMNRDPTHWGPDADKLNPERWFPEYPNAARERGRDLFAFLTFGQGPRKCPGEPYTRAVMACMLLGLIGRFKFGPAAGRPDVIEADGARRVGFGIVMKAEIWADARELPGWNTISQDKDSVMDGQM